MPYFKDRGGRRIWVNKDIVAMVVPSIGKEDIPVIGECEMVLKTGMVLHLTGGVEENVDYLYEEAGCQAE